MADDTIDREKAIDTANIMYKRCDTGSLEDYHNLVVECLKILPSAKPQIIRCKDCKHRILNKHYGEKGYINLKACCELDTGDPYELGRNAEDDNWFCADGERREDG